MRRFPAPIEAASSAFRKLPGVGPKTALRYAFALLRLPKDELALVLKNLAELTRVRRCTRCFTFSETELCDICSDATRTNDKLCVVAEARDIATIEATGMFKGRYFVLGGVLNPVDGITPDVLHVREFVERAQKDTAVTEIILAFSPDVHGETTILYLSRLLKPLSKNVTRLARGLPMGADIEYADEVTLASALQGRNTI